MVTASELRRLAEGAPVRDVLLGKAGTRIAWLAGLARATARRG